MTTTIAVSMPNDAYLQRLRVLGAWWRLGSSTLNPDLLIERVEARAFPGDAVAAGGSRNEETLLTSYGMW